MRGGREDHPGLDELTDDIAEERGDLDAFSQEPVGGGQGEQAYQRQSELAARRTPTGEPDAGAVVRSVWDTRPVDTRDFLIINLTAELAAPGTNAFDFQVPDGLVGFLRGFRFQMFPMPALTIPTDFRTSLTLDAVPVPDYFDLPLGPLQDEWVPTFVIGNSRQRIGARFVVGLALLPGTGLFFEFYGQFKLSDGRAAKLQVGNLQPGPPSYSTPRLEPPGMPAQPGGAARRIRSTFRRG